MKAAPSVFFLLSHPCGALLATRPEHDEHVELVRFLRETMATDRFPLSPRAKTLRAILAKLDAPAASGAVAAAKAAGRAQHGADEEAAPTIRATVVSTDA